MTLTIAQARAAAVRILLLRRSLATVAVARAAGDEGTALAALARMDALVQRAPLAYRTDAILRHRVEAPTTRRIRREGILSTARAVGYRPA